MTVSPWQRPLDPIEADVAIVGGGVTGAATAFWLRRLDPSLRVVILEAERIAHGASGRNAGFLLLGTHSDYASAVDTYGPEAARQIWVFTTETLDLIETHVDPGAVGLAWTGSVIAGGSPDEATRLQHSRDLLGHEGVETEWVDPSDLPARFGVHSLDGALFVPRGGTIDPARLVRWLVHESRAEVREGWRVVSADEGVRLGAADGGSVRAERALLAMNAWLPSLVPALAEAVRPVRAQMLATAPLDPFLTAPVYSHGGCFYARQNADGRLLLGGARHLHADDEVGYADATTDALQADLGAYLDRHLGVTNVRVDRRWSGTMGFSPDGLPLLGAVPDVPGAFYAAGFTGHGMGYGMRFGLLAARTLLNHPDPAGDLFHSERLKRLGSAPRLN